MTKTPATIGCCFCLGFWLPILLKKGVHHYAFSQQKVRAIFGDRCGGGLGLHPNTRFVISLVVVLMK
jgi:hypothetical protein